MKEQIKTKCPLCMRIQIIEIDMVKEKQKVFCEQCSYVLMEITIAKAK